MAKKTPLRRSKRNRKVETSSSEEEEEELEVKEEHGGSSSDEQNSDDDDDDNASPSASENEDDEEGDALQADGYGDDDSDENDDSEGEDDDDASDDGDQKEIYTGDESCTLDLRNLTAINSHQVNTATLYKSHSDSGGKKKGKKGKKKNDLMAASLGDKLSATIPPTDTTTIINEDQLLETAREGCQQILRGLWSLETERTDAGPMGLLPQQFEIKTPRELVRGVGDVRRRWTFYLCAACAILSRLLFHFSLPP